MLTAEHADQVVSKETKASLSLAYTRNVCNAVDVIFRSVSSVSLTSFFFFGVAWFARPLEIN